MAGDDYDNEAIRDWRKKQKQRNVNGTIRFLKSSKVPYEETNTANVVMVKRGNESILVSLKKVGSLIKCKFEGNGTWYTVSKSKFLELIEEPPQWDTSSTLDFGKYKGETVESLLVRDPDYLEWMMNKKIRWFTEETEDLIDAAVAEKYADNADPNSETFPHH